MSGARDQRSEAAGGGAAARLDRPVRLMREIRFSIDRDWAAAAHGAEGFERALPVTNSWGGWPSAVGVVPYLLLRMEVWGRPDPVTGYLINIQELDLLMREHALPQAARRLRALGVRLSPEQLVREIWEAVHALVPGEARLESLALWTTPHLSYTVREGADGMVELSQCFEFSAAHRLHVSSLSDAENVRIFGKCNNPNGHGHNYRLEVTITGSTDNETGVVMPLPAFERIVKEAVIDRLDHKHLNADVPEFAAVNPSVENIARTAWEMLEGRFGAAKLRRVRVWETAKTYAEYEG